MRRNLATYIYTLADKKCLFKIYKRINMLLFEIAMLDSNWPS